MRKSSRNRKITTPIRLFENREKDFTMFNKNAIPANPPREGSMNLHEVFMTNPKTGTSTKRIKTRDRRDNEWLSTFKAGSDHNRRVEFPFEDLNGLKEEFVEGFNEITILTHE